MGFVLLLPPGSNPSVSTSQYCCSFLKTLLRIKCRVGTLDDFRPCPDLASITLNSLMKKPCSHSPLPVLPWPRGEGLHVTSLFKKQGAGSGGKGPWPPRLPQATGSTGLNDILFQLCLFLWKASLSGTDHGVLSMAMILS